ncbi:hypothetical protein AX774_g1679 [Zancudomyces culisetae]|uniref:Uncharacterized protein n=1 Tax=Zancudomyces culisetae TaxID=1213189 RepID=A0A1R1PUZ3_ZANCU|nr:hypothetical protein AX774_g1679 [Zancudomyces culisetae]|eukprot:OMH84795.1 hypothetical protein AX774_g1679 [Zancudomyces culisetae]
MKYRDSEDESEEKLIKPAAVKPDVKEPKRGGRKKKEEKEEEELEEVNPEEYFSNTTTRKSRVRRNPAIGFTFNPILSRKQKTGPF